jgi:nucleoside-diphosphate-sugar epimerase
VSTGSQVLIAGATGMIGGITTKMCLERDDVDRVTTLGRRKTGIAHDKLREIEHDDFLDFEKVEDAFTGVDVCLYCIGVYAGQVSKDEFRKITADYTIAFGKALHAKSPKAVV